MSDLEYVKKLSGYECRKLITGIICVGEGMTDEQYCKLVGDVRHHFGTRFFEIRSLYIDYREFIIYLSPTIKR